MVKHFDSLKRYYWLNLYPYLLFVFFVSHGYVEHFGFIPIQDLIWLFLKYLFITTLLIFVFRWIYKNFDIAILATFVTLCFFFFFGAMHDFLKSIFTNGRLSRYSIVLPFFLLVYLIILLKIKGRGINMKLLKYLNVLFVVLILFDLGTLVYKIGTTPKQKDIAINCKQCDKPDVYLILLDEYAGQKQLIDEFGFDNNSFYNNLRQFGFYVSPDSRSNYTSTPFSISSILNMSYHDLKTYKRNDKNLDYCFRKIFQSSVVKSFREFGYKFYNFSMFDFKDHASPIKNKTFLISGTRLITSQTLFSRVGKDLYYNLLMQKFTNTVLYKNFVFRDLNNNNRLLNKTFKTAQLNEMQSKFVYLHLMLPHFPYYYKQNGELNNMTDLKYNNIGRKDLYLDYLKYSNGTILNLIHEIKTRSQKPPVIILLSDHGFRYGTNKNYQLSFSNLAAIHLPNKKYVDYETTFTNVNLFRIFFNSYFRQNLPILENKIVD